MICELSISADGYSAGLNQTEERPFGDDGGGWGDKQHAWFGETPDENRAEVDQMTAAKAFIMGRNMFGPVRGEWDWQWNCWWGDDPPFHGPVFVLKIEARGRADATAYALRRGLGSWPPSTGFPLPGSTRFRGSRQHPSGHMLRSNTNSTIWRRSVS